MLTSYIQTSFEEAVMCDSETNTLVRVLRVEVVGDADGMLFC